MTYANIQIKPAREFAPDDLRRLFIFRHSVFVNRLGWVPPRGCEEVDYFDTLNPHYAICQDGDGEFTAVARLLPTSGPTMLRDVFPELLGGTPCPNDAAVWEISRFALRPSHRDRGGHRRTLATLVEGLFGFAEAQGIRRLIAVSDTRLERLVVETTGLPIHRLSPPRQIGIEWTVAGWTDVPAAGVSRLAQRHHPDHSSGLSRPAA